MIRKFKDSDKAEYLAMTHIFHTSDAVLAPIDTAAYERSFKFALSPSPYIDGYVYEMDGEICGYITIAHSFSTEIGNECIWIEELYVKPEFRKKGIATAFMKFLNENYGDAVCRIRLEVEKENTAAVRLYEKNGYKWLLYEQMYFDIKKEADYEN